MSDCRPAARKVNVGAEFNSAAAAPDRTVHPRAEDGVAAVGADRQEQALAPGRAAAGSALAASLWDLALHIPGVCTTPPVALVADRNVYPSGEGHILVPVWP